MTHIRGNLYHEAEGTKDHAKGYYWADEAEDLNGPHDTLEQAEVEMQAYIEWLTKEQT